MIIKIKLLNNISVSLLQSFMESSNGMTELLLLDKEGKTVIHRFFSFQKDGHDDLKWWHRQGMNTPPSLVLVIPAKGRIEIINFAKSKS